MRLTPLPARLAALATTAVLLTSCSDDSSGDPSPVEDSPTSVPAGDLVDATRLTDAAGEDELVPGQYAMGFSSPDADTPMVLIDVPAGYSGRGDGFEISAQGEDGSAFRHLDTWTVAVVATESCGPTEWVDPGPAVDDLAEALRALEVWETTPPRPVTIGGHEGVTMELNVPENLPDGCGGQPASFREHTGGTQGIGPGKVQRLWIVDVDGRRLMLLAGYFPGPEGPTPEQVDEMTAMVERATFVELTRCRDRPGGNARPQLVASVRLSISG